MIRIGVTQRVVKAVGYYERRDALDQRWGELLCLANFQMVIIPNLTKNIVEFIDKFELRGIILTGGNDLVEYGGDAPERDLLEKKIIETCIHQKIPILGVCRGMQLLNIYFGGTLKPIKGHVSKSMNIILKGEFRQVNSYHNYGVREVSVGFEILGYSVVDQEVKAMKHSVYPFYGIMWHPERNSPVDLRDIELLKIMFETNLKK